jgi:VWFA-related protein
MLRQCLSFISILAFPIGGAAQWLLQYSHTTADLHGIHSIGHEMLVSAQPEKVRRSPLNVAVEVEGLIRLDVTVGDQSGDAVPGLGRNDFTVLDNDRRQNILAFRASNSDPSNSDDSLNVILLIDTLNLPPHLAEFERRQAVEFLQRSDGHLAHPVAIYSLEDYGFFLTSRPSTDGDALARAVASDTKVDAFFLAPYVHRAFSRRVVDATFSSFPALTGLKALGTIARAEDSRPGKKLLLWIGPGLSGTGAYFPSEMALMRHASSGRQSREEERDLLERICWYSTLLRQARVTLDCFSEGEEVSAVPVAGSTTPGVDYWRRFLDIQPDRQPSWMYLYKKVLAVQSGGQVLPPSKELAPQMAECVKDASSFYTLTFDPPPAGHADEYHFLKVAMNEPGLIARTSTGYYDQPFYSDPPASSIRPVTVAQLEQILQMTHGDASGERQLSTLAMTERLSHAKLKSLLAELHAKKLREPLEMLADESAFLEPPPSEIPADPPPDPSEQLRILAAATDYLSRIMPKLPDFFATRTSVYYREVAAYPELNPKIVPVPLHAEQRSKSTVLYRHGAEVVDLASLSNTPTEDEPLHTYGSFGPTLSTIQAVLKLPGDVTWKRWDKDGTARLAVFRFASVGSPSVTLAGCCIPDSKDGAQNGISANPRGEIVIDPSSGAILRVQLEPVLQGFVPAKRSDIMVSYGPVQIGGNTYILPLRSVGIWRGRSVQTLAEWIGEWNVGFNTWGPYETQVNVFTFDGYHMFSGETRVLPSFTPTP